jgi:hypothetical protein
VFDVDATHRCNVLHCNSYAWDFTYGVDTGCHSGDYICLANSSKYQYFSIIACMPYILTVVPRHYHLLNCKYNISSIMYGIVIKIISIRIYG